MKLTKEQKEKLKEYMKIFMSSEELKKEFASRKEHNKFVRDLLSESKLKSMGEIEFGELISKSWASLMWGNKEYLIQKIINDNGLDKIKEELHNLLYGKEPFSERYDRFVKNIKGLGPATITEILCLFDPDNYGIWNKVVRTGLKILGFNELPLKKYSITGKEYVFINNTLKEIAEYFKELGVKDAELLFVDYFLYEIVELEKEKIEEEEDKVTKITRQTDFDHNEIRDLVKEIGIALGFEVDTEKNIAPGATVDCIWVAKIANLGVVTYVFEVHRRGSIDSLILNLQKALNNPTVQKIIAISDTERIEKIKKETKGLPENFRKTLTFWEVEDVIKTHERLSEVMKSINKLDLVKSSFVD